MGEGVGSARVRVLAEAAARRPVRVVHSLSMPFSIYLYLSIYLSAPAADTGREQPEVVSAVDEAWLDDAGILAKLSHHCLLGGLLPLEVGSEEAGQPGREARCRVREPSCASVGFESRRTSPWTQPPQSQRSRRPCAALQPPSPPRPPRRSRRHCRGAVLAGLRRSRRHRRPRHRAIRWPPAISRASRG